MFGGFEAVLTLGVALGGLAAPVAVGPARPAAARSSSSACSRPLAVAAARAAAAPARRRAAACATPTSRCCGRCRCSGALPAATIEQLAAGARARRVGARRRWCSRRATGGDRYYVVRVRRARRSSATAGWSARWGAGPASATSPCSADEPRTATVRAGGQAPLRVAVLTPAAVPHRGHAATRRARRRATTRWRGPGAGRGPAGRRRRGAAVGPGRAATARRRAASRTGPARAGPGRSTRRRTSPARSRSGNISGSIGYCDRCAAVARSRCPT